jgi:NADH-quinone oxidoreductase subunit M
MFTGIFGSIATHYSLWFTVLAGVCIILAAVYTLNLIRKIFYGNVSAAVSAAGDIRLSEKLALGVIVILIVWIGIYSQPFLRITEGISADITNGIINRPEIARYLTR